MFLFLIIYSAFGAGFIIGGELMDRAHNSPDKGKPFALLLGAIFWPVALAFLASEAKDNQPPWWS